MLSRTVFLKAVLKSWIKWFWYLHLKYFVAIASQNTVFFLYDQGILTLGKEAKSLLSDNLISKSYLEEWDNISQTPTVSFNFSKWKKKRKNINKSFMNDYRNKTQTILWLKELKSIILNQQFVNHFMYNWTHPHKLRKQRKIKSSSITGETCIWHYNRVTASSCYRKQHHANTFCLFLMYFFK